MIHRGLLATASFCCSILAADFLALPWYSCCVGLAGSSVLAVAAYKRRRRFFFFCVCLCFFCLGAARLGLASAWYDGLPHYLGGASVYVEGTVTERGPSYKDDDGEKIRYTVAVDAFSYEGETRLRPGGGSIYVTAPAVPLIEPSSQIAYTGRLKPIYYYRNRGAYDALRNHKAKGIFLRSYAGKEALTVLEGPSGWAYRLRQARERLVRDFQSILSEDEALILGSLLFGGQYDRLPPELVESFSTTGLIHILSVSGSHIALLLGFVQMAGRAFGLGSRKSFALSAVLIVCYGAMAEFAAPVVRAGIMGAIGAYGAVARREYDGMQALSAAVFLMLMHSPYVLYDLSFRLSCGASAGIIAFYGPVKKYAAFLPSFLADSLSLCVSAQILLVPALLAYFYSLPVYSLAANILIAPILDAVILLGLGASVLSFMCLPPAQILLHLIGPLLELAVTGNYFLASLPHSRYWAGALSVPTACAWYMAAAAFLFPALRRRLLFSAAAACALSWAWAWHEKADVVVHVFDVGLDKATCVVVSDDSCRLWYNKNLWTSPQQVKYVLAPALRHEGIFLLAECTVSGRDGGQVGEIIAAEFALDTPCRLEESPSPQLLVQGAIPYYVYERTPRAWPSGRACLEIRDMGKMAFPRDAAAVVIFGSSFGKAVDQWLEAAELYQIPCYSPARDGQITGKYKDGMWVFTTYAVDTR